ncbi:unnamed protein product [Rotaria sp. Silwood1]|nr:unnamed protein product [Rotaria sp. Silwood1]
MEDNNDDDDNDFPFNGLLSSIEQTRFLNDENLDSTMEKHNLHEAFLRSFIMATMKRETTPSGKMCY